ncbi:predicted protein [Postia placenta Mad-698-R]|nr:predicted protein [Postia placenta Mad-698-R]
MGVYVKAELHDRTYRDYPGYKPQDLPMDRTYTLPFNAVNGYAVSTKGAAYVHFVEIMTSLAGQVYSVSPTDDPATTDPSSAARVPISSLFVHLKDNAVNSSCADDPGAGCETARRNREWLLAYGEVKKTCIRKTVYEADMPIDITRLHEHISRQHDPVVGAPQETKATHGVAGPNRKRKDSLNAETNRLHKKICLDVDRLSPAPAAQIEMKRGRLTRQEAQIGSCATELMSHNIRCYGTGIMIEDFMVKLWYADRHGVVVSRPFDMFVECDKPLLAVATIAGASVAKMGVCPFLRFPSNRSRLAKKPQYLRHIVDMKCWISRTIEEIRLPRAFMALHNFGYERREFQMIVMKKYEKLEQVESVDEFTRVFCDVVRAHHWVWETSSILHRDISSNNIMFYRDDGRVAGVLYPEKHEFGHLPEWEDSTMFTIGFNKREFLYVDGVRAQISSRVHPVYRPLWNSWVNPLAAMVGRYAHDRDGVQLLRTSLLRTGRGEHSVTELEEVREDIETPTARMLRRFTYPKLMSVLGEPLDIDS